MEKLTQATLHAVDAGAKGKRVKICILIGKDYQLPLAVAKLTHRLVVVGDEFKPLYRFVEKNQQYNPAVTVEATYTALPLQAHAFDVFIVARPMPKGSNVPDELERLKQFVKPNGTLMWFHPIYEGTWGKLRWLFSCKYYRVERHTLCKFAMEKGFKEIGQVLVKGHRSQQYVLTKAIVSEPLITQ